jgi:hypothetical protein
MGGSDRTDSSRGHECTPPGSDWRRQITRGLQLHRPQPADAAIISEADHLVLGRLGPRTPCLSRRSHTPPGNQCPARHTRLNSATLQGSSHREPMDRGTTLAGNVGFLLPSRHRLKEGRRWQSHGGSLITIFREGAVRIVRETGKPIAQVARGLLMPVQWARHWRRGQRRRASRAPFPLRASRWRLAHRSPSQWPWQSTPWQRARPSKCWSARAPGGGWPAGWPRCA